MRYTNVTRFSSTVTYWLMWLFVTRERHLGSPLIHYNVRTCVTFDRSVLRDWPLKVKTYFSAFYFIRYLQVVPNSSDDDNLLIEVLKVLDIILSSPRQPPEPVVAWVARVVLQRDGPQMTLLRNVQTSTAGSQTVSESKRYALLMFFLIL